MDIAIRLKKLREDKGLSQYRLARHSGVSQSFLSSLEAGAKWPTVYTLNKICGSLGVSLSEFFSEEGARGGQAGALLAELIRLDPGQCSALAGFLSCLRTAGGQAGQVTAGTGEGSSAGNPGTSGGAGDLNRLEEALRLSEQKFSSFFNFIPVPVLVCDLYERRIKDANEVFLQNLGYRRDEVVGRRLTDFELWADPNERDSLGRLIVERGALHDIVVGIRRKNGDQGTALFSARIMEIDGTPCIVGVMRDITGRKGLEKLRETCL